MWTGTRVAAHLGVLGAALVVAAVHGTGAAAPAPSPAAVVATYTPPSATAAATMLAAATRPVRVRREPTHHAPAHTIAPRDTTRTTRVAARSTARATHHARHAAKLSFTAALQRAIARIPTYRPGTARWVVSRAYAFWGTADWYHDVLYVSPDVPVSKVYDVAVHEWSHELSVLDYAGDVTTATAAMNAWFGGHGLTGPERAADCMAILQGATWTHYTTCTDHQWRLGAARLVAGERL